MDGALDFRYEAAKIEVRVPSCTEFELYGKKVTLDPSHPSQRGTVSLLRNESTKSGNAVTEKKLRLWRSTIAPPLLPEIPALYT